MYIPKLTTRVGKSVNRSGTVEYEELNKKFKELMNDPTGNHKKINKNFKKREELLKQFKNKGTMNEFVDTETKRLKNDKEIFENPDSVLSILYTSSNQLDNKLANDMENSGITPTNTDTQIAVFYGIMDDAQVSTLNLITRAENEFNNSAKIVDAEILKENINTRKVLVNSYIDTYYFDAFIHPHKSNIKTDEEYLTNIEEYLTNISDSKLGNIDGGDFRKKKESKEKKMTMKTLEQIEDYHDYANRFGYDIWANIDTIVDTLLNELEKLLKDIDENEITISIFLYNKMLDKPLRIKSLQDLINHIKEDKDEISLSNKDLETFNKIIKIWDIFKKNLLTVDGSKESIHDKIIKKRHLNSPSRSRSRSVITSYQVPGLATMSEVPTAPSGKSKVSTTKDGKTVRNVKTNYESDEDDVFT